MIRLPNDYNDPHVSYKLSDDLTINPNENYTMSHDLMKHIGVMAELLDWTELRWEITPINCPVLWGKAPGERGKLFPPSFNDGNGMLWLMKQMERFDYDAVLTVAHGAKGISTKGIHSAIGIGDEQSSSRKKRPVYTWFCGGHDTHAPTAILITAIRAVYDKKFGEHFEYDYSLG